jgi:hypothetical protein
MSYDIYFIRPEDCADPATALEADAPSDPASRANDRRLARMLVEAYPELEIFPTEGDGGLESGQGSDVEAIPAGGVVEINTPEDGSGIQIALYGRFAALSVPYWYEGREAEAVFADVERYATLLVERGGYRMYDPQKQRVFATVGEAIASMTADYVGFSASVPEIIAHAEARRRRPWWKLW